MKIRSLRTTDLPYAGMEWVPWKTPLHPVISYLTRHFKSALAYSAEMHISTVCLSSVSSAEMKAIQEAVLESL